MSSKRQKSSKGGQRGDRAATAEPEAASEPEIEFDWPAYSGLLIKIRRDEYISGDVLADALEKDRGAPLPDNVLDYLIRFLRGEVPKPRGRPPVNPGAAASRRHLACAFYRLNLKAVQDGSAQEILREIPGATKWEGPPHEIAARMTARGLQQIWPNISYRHVLNIVSSQK